MKKKKEEVIALLRQSWLKTGRASMALTSEKDHMIWGSFVKSTEIRPEGWKEYTFHEQGDEDQARSLVRLLKFWRYQNSAMHQDVRSGNQIANSSLISHPPRIAQFALLLIPRKNREHMIGDLEEEYRTKLLPQYGVFWARLWYWEQTMLALGFYAWPFVKRVLGLATIWKLIGR